MNDTVGWKVEDNNDKVHAFVLKNIYLIPEPSNQVLSPQHLSQQTPQDYCPIVGGKGEYL